MSDDKGMRRTLFERSIKHGGDSARTVRAVISIAGLRNDPELKDAVMADCRALAKAGLEQRGYADLEDLTRAGYTKDFALGQAEIIAHSGRKTFGLPPRGYRPNDGEAA